MPVLQAGNIADLMVTGLRELGELKFTDISSPLQRYVAMSRLMKKSRVDFYSAGWGVQWDVMIDDNGSAEFVGLYNSDNVNQKNLFTQGNTTWRHITWNWAMDEREVVMNGSARRIVDLMRARRIAAFISAIKKFERAFWRCPASTNTTDPYGAPYWIVKNNTQGFNGGLPSGYSDVGGIVPATVSAWQNYTDQYALMTEDDGIEKWARAADFTYFEPPVENTPTFNTGDDYGFYTTYRTYVATKRQLKGQNDDLGFDVDPMNGKPSFRRVPITWVPQLDEDTTDPVYGVNWGEFKTAGLRSLWLKETVIPKMAGQHMVSVNHSDTSLQWLTRDRRRHFVIAKDTTMPA
jgi:hypothetical protein